MFRIHLYNFDIHKGGWHTLEDAIAAVKRHGFQAAIYCGERLVASWCPIAGLIRHPQEKT